MHTSRKYRVGAKPTLVCGPFFERHMWLRLDCCNPSRRCWGIQKWRSSLLSREPFEADARVRRADGKYRAFLHHKVPLRNDQGSITGAANSHSLGQRLAS